MDLVIVGMIIVDLLILIGIVRILSVGSLTGRQTWRGDDTEKDS